MIELPSVAWIVLGVLGSAPLCTLYVFYEDWMGMRRNPQQFRYAYSFPPEMQEELYRRGLPNES